MNGVTRRAHSLDGVSLAGFEAPVTEQEIRDASLQFVRKLAGFSVLSSLVDPHPNKQGAR